MKITDRTTYEVVLFDVPPFPAHLEQEAEDKVLGQDEAGEFLQWWCEAASARGWRHPGRPLGEEWVQARRLMSRYDVKTLKRKAINYFPEANDDWHGVNLLRGFVVWLRGNE